MITTRQVRTDIIYILRPIFHEGVAKLLLGSYLSTQNPQQNEMRTTIKLVEKESKEWDRQQELLN